VNLSPSPSPFGQPPAPGVSVPELMVGAVLAILGLWSLAKWLRTEFVAESLGDQLLYALHVTSRVGLWLGLAAFFFGLALLDHPLRYTWYFLVLLGLAGLQLVTAVALGQGSGGAGRRGGAGGGVNEGRPGNSWNMESAGHPPGPLEPDKHGETADPGHPQPEAAEVESARLLANQARPILGPEGFGDDELRTLADEYVALDRGEDLDRFVDWARARRGSVR